MKDETSNQFALFIQHYQALSKVVKEFNIANHLKGVICKSLDDAYLWTKESLLTVPVDDEPSKVVDLPKAG